MPKTFSLTASVTISLHATVEASSLKEALQKALDCEMETLITDNWCSEDQDTWLTSGELDGEPFDITAEEK